jgi:hypothetical protein
MNGKSVGMEQQSSVDEIVVGILNEKLGACRFALESIEENCIEGSMVRELWEAELHIATLALEQLTTK